MIPVPASQIPKKISPDAMHSVALKIIDCLSPKGMLEDACIYAGHNLYSGRKRRETDILRKTRRHNKYYVGKGVPAAMLFSHLPDLGTISKTVIICAEPGNPLLDHIDRVGSPGDNPNMISEMSELFLKDFGLRFEKVMPYAVAAKKIQDT